MKPPALLSVPILAASLLGSALPSLAQETADVILTGGKILTVDEAFTVAEAIAVKGDRILATGDAASIAALAGPDTETLDLAGATVMPGLIDSHVHSTGAALHEYDHPIPEMETIADVLAYIESRAAVLEEGDWIQLNQVFITRLRERRFPTRAEMDAAAPRHPVVFRTGPDSALNSLALELSGIDMDFVLPEGSNARIERDPATGELTGIIRTAGGLAKVTPPRGGKPPAGFDERVGALRELFADYNRWGITSVSDRSASDAGIRLYEELRKRGELTCRVYLYRGVNAQAPLEEIQQQIRAAAESPLHAYDPWIWQRGIKIFLDGGMLTGSAYMREPWGVSESYGIVDPDYRGILYVEPDKLYEIARAALENGLQMTAHSVGDAAVETLVGAYARIAENDFPVNELRPCVTHCNFMSEAAIETMAKHGIVADLQPAWLYLDGSTLDRQFGRERLRWFQPYRTLFEKGVVVGGGSDHMQKVGSLRSVNPYNPFLGMWIAMAREPRWMEEPLHPGERLDREQAIRLYTVNNAWLSFEEKEKGSLEPGKLADLIVLDRDILECPLEEVREIQVRRTYVGGHLVFQSEEE